MDGRQNNIISDFSKNQLKIGAGILSGILLRSIIVIGDSTPTWNDAAVSNSHASVKLSAEKAYARGGVDCDYLARCFGQWDARLAKWLAEQDKSKKPLNYATLAAYFKVASKKHGKCTILLYESEQLLARHGARALLGFIEQTKEYCWYVLIGDNSLNGLEIPEYMRPRRIDITGFTLTLREMKIYFSASGILLTRQQYEMLYRIVDGWTLAAYMVNNHMKRGEELRENDLDTAVTEVFRELDDLVADGMVLQERYTATLLSEFEAFPYELALACCPYNEGVIRKALEKTPGIRFSGNGASLAMHPLIRAYWQTKKHAVPKKLRAGCKSRAAKWYATNKKYLPAMVCAVDAGDYPLVRYVLREMTVQRQHLNAGEINEILERIDDRDLQANPMLWAYRVTLYFISMDNTRGNMEKASLERYLSTHCETPEARQAKGEMLLLSAFIDIVQPCSIAYFTRAAECFEEHSEICDTYLNDHVRNGTPIPYAGGEEYTLLDTCRTIQQAAPIRYKCTNNWGRGHEHLCYAEYGYLTGNTQQFFDNANRALTDAMAYRQWYIARAANLMLLLQYTKLGMVSEATDSWRAIHTLAQMEKNNSAVIKDAADARVLFCTGQLYLLPKWIRDADEFESRTKYYQTGREYYIRAYYLLCKGHLHRALRLVCEAMGRTSYTDEWIPQLHLMVLKMMVYAGLGDMEHAQATLNECYERMAPEQLTMPLLEFGKSMAKLMEQFIPVKQADSARHLPPADWMEAIREGAMERQRGNDAFFTGYYKWLQEEYGTSLTGNEYIILQLLCLGYTNDDAGKEMGISKNYVRSVIRRICKKLGVDSEADAVAFGRSINIQNPSVIFQQ